MKFQLTSTYNPNGDQPEAIKKLTEGLYKNYKHQTLLGVTGSGKTFSVANVIEKTQRPTLVISHNKTLAVRNIFSKQVVFRYFHPEFYKFLEQSLDRSFRIGAWRVILRDRLVTNFAQVRHNTTWCNRFR